MGISELRLVCSVDSVKEMTTKATTPPMRKTAISVPAGLLAEVDRVARQRGESRSQFVQRLLVEAVRARNDVEFTNKLNDFFAGTANRAAHREESKVWAQSRPAWDDERW